MPQSLDSFDNDYYVGETPRLGNVPDLRVPNEGQYPTNVGIYSPGAEEPFSGGEKFRGSSELPLTSEGLMKAHTLAQKLAMKGGLDRIVTSDLGRTVQTAKIISHYTHAPVTDITKALGPWHLGGLEGQPVDKDNVDLMNHLISEEPDLKLPGRGPLSTSDGESFNDFRRRTLPYLQKLIGEARSRPQERTGVVTHYRVRKLLEAWMRNGMPDDGSIDSGEMTLNSSNNKPGSLERLHVDPFNGPQLSNVDLDHMGLLQGGLYFIRHEDTPWNRKESGFSRGPNKPLDRSGLST
ncbi:MAG: histidine phosphatase family protein [Thaumarchaeota archaeon]|nr:histidine phosphatase family protein [Nitrososphaerota archaeon]